MGSSYDLAEFFDLTRWTYFRHDEDAPPQAYEAMSLVVRALKGNSQIQEDKERLKQLLKLDPEELCRKQSECKC